MTDSEGARDAARGPSADAVVRLFLVGAAWQVVPGSLLLWEYWDGGSSTTVVLLGLVVLVVPALAWRAHRSWAFGLVVAAVPAVFFWFMMLVFACIVV